MVGDPYAWIYSTHGLILIEPFVGASDGPLRLPSLNSGPGLFIRVKEDDKRIRKVGRFYWPNTNNVHKKVDSPMYFPSNPPG